MVLGGLALVLSRLIDNSVVVLENIFRHMEEGEDAVNGGGTWRPGGAAGSAGRDVHYGHRVFPGGVPVRRQPIPIQRAWRLAWCWRWLPRTWLR